MIMKMLQTCLSKSLLIIIATSQAVLYVNHISVVLVYEWCGGMMYDTCIIYNQMFSYAVYYKLFQLYSWRRCDSISQWTSMSQIYEFNS